MSDRLPWITVQKYVESLVPARSAVLQQMEQRAANERFPIIGPACGFLCYQLARSIGARRVFELGSGFGYSTAWFARAVKENGGGAVHHVVWDQALSEQARGYLEQLGYGGLVHYHVSEAVAALRESDGGFDIIFNDIDKHQYPGSLPVIADKLRVGGLLIIDNLLWHGRIFDSADRSASTEGVRRVTELLAGDARWATSLLPVRDGLCVATRLA